MNNELATKIESGRISEDTPSMNNSSGEGADTPPMDFDAWVEDPFPLSKEVDVFSSFASDVEAVNSNSNNTSLSGVGPDKVVVSEKHHATPDDAEPNAEKKAADPLPREEIRSPPSSQNETNSCIGATGSISKITLPAKKKSDYIPISRRKKKPKGMPKRPLSAYNLYFQAQRTKIIAAQEEGKPRIGFEGLGKIIGKQWRDLSGDEKKEYSKLAEKDSERYRKEMDAYQEMKAKRFAEEDRRAAAQTPVLSSLGSSREQRRLTILPVAEVFGDSALVSHPPDSMVSGVSSVPPASVSYRPIRVEQAPSPPRYGVHSNSVPDSRYPPHPGEISSHYFPQPPAAHASEPIAYNSSAPGPGAAILSPNNNNCPMPPGMEVVLSDRNGIDRKYSVQYTCYSMTRENANKYIDSITTRGHRNSNSAPAPAPWPQSTPPPPTTASNRDFGEQWGV